MKKVHGIVILPLFVIVEDSDGLKTHGPVNAHLSSIITSEDVPVVMVHPQPYTVL